MAKDQSYQVSSQNSENKGNFMNENPNGGYPSAKLHRKREGLRFAQALKIIKIGLAVSSESC